MPDVQELNLTLHEESPTFLYAPFRDGDVTMGWNSSYSNNATYTPVPAGTFGQDVGGGGVGSGIAFRRTLYDGSTVTLSFEGTAVYLCLTVEGASYALSVDNQPVTKALPASAGADCSGYGGQTLAVADGLIYGAHTAVLTALIPNTNANFSFFGGVVTISAGVAGSTVSEPLYIDDTASGWTLAPDHESWDYVTWDTSAYNSTFTYTGYWNQAANAKYAIGTGISALWVLSPARFNSYSYTVSLDGNETTYNATNFWTSDQQVAFFAGGLDPSLSHTLTLTNYDASSPSGPTAGHGPALYIDALVLVGSTPPPTSVSLASTASATAQLYSGTDSRAVSRAIIAGGTVGAVVGFLLLGLATYILLRRRWQRAAIRMKPTPFEEGGLPAPRFTAGTGAASDASGKRRDVPHPILHAPSGRPPLLPSVTGLSSTPEGSTASIPLRGVATIDLVQVLNERVRDQPVASVEAPPVYDRD